MAKSRYTLKTYTTQGESKRRIPSEYEILSTANNYDYPRKHEIPGNPVAEWMYDYREDSPLRAENWDLFADPRRTTYKGYNSLQDEKETVVDGIVREIDETGYDSTLSDEWIAFLDANYGALRFPGHGLQMMAAYLAQVSPGSRMQNCAAFQAADECRRVQRIAYRVVQMNTNRGGMDIAGHQNRWEKDAAFQPLRELIEKALIAYDMGETFTALNLVIKPRIDPIINEYLAGALAAANGDTSLRAIHFSLNEDALWHRAWSAELVRSLIADTAANADHIQGWVDKWKAPAKAALDALAGTFSQAPTSIDGAAAAAKIDEQADARVADLLTAPVPA